MNQLSLLFLATFIAASAECGYAQTNVLSAHRVEKLSVQIDQQLQVLSTNKSAAVVLPLKNSLAVLEYSYLNEPGDRKDVAHLWLKVLTALDQDLDLNFNPANADFNWHVRPPPDGPNGTQYPAGTAPETLKDPTARSNYLAAIQNNSQKAEAAGFQLQLHELNDQASSTLGQFLRSNYSSSSPADKKELDEILGQFALTPDRRKQMDGYMAALEKAPTGDFPFPKH